MPALKDTAHVIPLHSSELVDVLCSDSLLPQEQQTDLRELCGLICLTYHLRYHRRLMELKAAYAPFDPDSDATTLIPVSASQKQTRLNALFSDFSWLLDRAHFRHLERDDIEPMLTDASEFGMHMQVDFSAFEHVAIFIRGETYQERILNSWRTWFQETAVEVPIYQRLVLILKFRPHPRLGPKVNTDQVYLKLFKDIPRADVDMLLPAARFKLKILDQGKIGAGLLSGIVTVLWRMAAEIEQAVRTLLLSGDAMWGLAAGLVGYGTKSYFDYHQTRQAYHLNLTQSLYFQNLDSNAGVLTRLFDEAEEQESRTAILAYYVLLRYAGSQGMSSEHLDGGMGLFLDRYADVPLVVEAGKPLEKLQALGLVRLSDNRALPLPLDQAIAQMKARLIQPGSNANPWSKRATRD